MTEAFTGRDVDVAILGSRNPSVRGQLLGVARACSKRGMSVQFIIEEFSAKTMNQTASFYRESGFNATCLVTSTWRCGPFAYPSAAAQVYLLHSLQRILRDYRPGLLLTHSDNSGVYRVIHAWAKRVDVIGAVLQEGILAYRQRDRSRRSRAFFRHIGRRLLNSLYHGVFDLDCVMYQFADHALLWGEAGRRYFIDRGRTIDNTHVVGSPAFDHVSQRASLAPSELRSVLFAHQPQPNRELELETCRHLIDVCANRLKCRLLFRPHPRGYLHSDEVIAWAAQTTSPDLIELVTDREITDHMERASVLVTYYSTSAYHAAVRGLPLVLINWVSSLYTMDAPTYGAALPVNSPCDLENSLRLALDDQECRQRLYDGATRWLLDHLGVLDGRASQRVADVIAELIVRKSGKKFESTD